MGTIVAPSSRTARPKRAWSSSSSFVVCVSIFILPSSSISPALQRAPSTLSWSNSPPLDTPRAPHQSIASLALIVVVIIVVFGVIVVAHLAFHSPFRTEMAVDIESLEVLHTLVVCRSRGRRRLALISMWEVLGLPGWGWGGVLVAMAGHGAIVVVTVDGVDIVLVVDGGGT